MDNANRDPLYVVCSCDENFVPPLTAMLKSLSVNHRKSSKLVIYVLENKLTDRSRKKISSSLKTEPVEIRFIDIDETPLNNMLVGRRFTRTAYYRLIAYLLLPQEIKKIIYLDSDLIVNEDIENLWDIDIEENHLLAVQEQGKKLLYVSSPCGLLNYKELGIDPTRKYFNSGVMVIDLDKWRRDDIGLKVIKYMEQNKRYIRWYDQDGLNAVLAHKWGELDHRWNLCTTIFDNISWEEGPIKDKSIYTRLVSHPHIIHFNTWDKPWYPFNDHPHRNLFYTFLNMTEWKEWRAKDYYTNILYRFINYLSTSASHKYTHRKTAP